MMKNIKPYFIIIAILAMLFVGCPNDETKSDDDVQNTTQQSKITSLQVAVNEETGTSIDLSQSKYSITDYNAVINKAITINGAGKDFGKADLTADVSGITLKGMTNVKTLTASANIGNGSLKIASSSLTNLNIYGGGSHSISLFEDMSIDMVLVNKHIPDDDEPVRVVLDKSSAEGIACMEIKSDMLLDASGDGVVLRNVIFNGEIIAISSNLTLFRVGKRLDNDEVVYGGDNDDNNENLVKVTLKNDAVSTDKEIVLYIPKGTSIADLSADFIISAFEMIAPNNTINSAFKAALIQSFTAKMTEIFGATFTESKEIVIKADEENNINIAAIYSITIANDIQNGTVSVNPSDNAAVGTTITLTAEPAANYALDTWSVTYTGGNVSVTNNQFTMPSGDVTVSASFVKGIGYRSASWDESQSKVVYTDLAKREGEYTTVTDSLTTWADGIWYVVENDVTINDRITVAGTANLILCDGATLTASKGITVSRNAEAEQYGDDPEIKTLNIYAQTNGTGTLIATGEGCDTGIGGCNDDDNVKAGGAITIHGGVITASADPSDEYAAGIGGGFGKPGGTVTIYGGTVTATGNDGSAGIGGGSDSGNNNGTGGTVAIYGGTVIATGKGGGAGIGAPRGNSTHGPLTIASGLTVIAGTSSSDAQSMTADAYISSRNAYVKITDQP